MADETLRRRIASLRALVGTTEATLWPTCLLCTQASEVRYPPDGIWIPVQSYRIEPGWNDLHPPREVGMRGAFVIVAECHGDKQSARVEMPFWWGDAHKREAIRSLMFFGQEKQVDHGMVTRIH